MEEIGKYKWSLFKKIVSDCHSHKGTIFGGAVRDAYIHDYNASKFYQKYDPPYTTESKYNDMQITEFPGRFVVPRDIDCIILAEDHKNLVKTLQTKYHVQIKLESDADYLSATPHGMYHFIRYSIVELRENEYIVLQLDMIVQLHGVDIVHPFKENIDMDVNALWWRNNAVMINPSFLSLIGSLYGELSLSSMQITIIHTTLLDKIVSKTATICDSKCPTRRILKMKKYGWDVKYSYRTIHISNQPYDGLCVLCQDTIIGDHSTFTCKCAHICMCCLKTHYAALPRCTICKREVDCKELENDLRIYDAIHGYANYLGSDAQDGRPSTLFIDIHEMMLHLIEEPIPVD
jgi:hypothetical protein